MATTSSSQSRAFSPQARARARRNAAQALYQWLLTGAAMATIIHEFEHEREEELRQADRDYFRALLSGCEEHAADIERSFAPFLDRDLERLDPVERAILLLGAYELCRRPEIPTRVALDEAVKLAKMFGAEGSYRYVNAVLDKLARTSRRDTGDGRGRDDRDD